MSGWQPISTAPKDRSDVHIYCSDTKEQFIGYRHRGQRGLWVYALDEVGKKIACRPTHWRPLPEPPK